MAAKLYLSHSMQVSRALRHEMDVAWILRVLHLCKWCLSALFQGTGASLPSDAANVRACQCSCKRLRRGAPEFQLLPVLHSAARSSTLAWPDFAFAVSSTCGKQSLSKMELVSGSNLYPPCQRAAGNARRSHCRVSQAQCTRARSPVQGQKRDVQGTYSTWVLRRCCGVM